jgi:hypothetical protein
MHCQSTTGCQSGCQAAIGASCCTSEPAWKLGRTHIKVSNMSEPHNADSRGGYRMFFHGLLFTLLSPTPAFVLNVACAHYSSLFWDYSAAIIIRGDEPIVHLVNRADNCVVHRVSLHARRERRQAGTRSEAGMTRAIRPWHCQERNRIRYIKILLRCNSLGCKVRTGYRNSLLGCSIRVHSHNKRPCRKICRYR